MEAQELKPIALVSVPSIRATLRAMPIGETAGVKVSQFKTIVVRNAASSLKKEGLEFRVSEANLLDEVLVTRLK